MLYLLYAAAVLTTLYLVVRWAVVGRGGAREVLDARYAGGEICREEYERLWRDLETSRTPLRNT